MLNILSREFKNIFTKTEHPFFNNLSSLIESEQDINLPEIVAKNLTLFQKNLDAPVDTKSDYIFRQFFYLGIQFSLHLQAEQFLRAIDTYIQLLECYQRFQIPTTMNPQFHKHYLVARDQLLCLVAFSLSNGLTSQGKNWAALLTLSHAASVMKSAVDSKIQYYGELAFNLGNAVLALQFASQNSSEFDRAKDQALRMLGFLYFRHEFQFNSPNSENGICYHEPALNFYSGHRALFKSHAENETALYLAISCHEIAYLQEQLYSIALTSQSQSLQKYCHDLTNNWLLKISETISKSELIEESRGSIATIGTGIQVNLNPPMENDEPTHDDDSFEHVSENQPLLYNAPQN